MPISHSGPNTGITADRKTPEKLQFLIDHYPTMTKPQLAQTLGETTRWVKRALVTLAQEGKIVRKVPAKSPEELLTAEKWPEPVKKRAIELREISRTTTQEISDILKQEFGFIIKPGALEFWFIRFGCSMDSKMEWLEKHLPKEEAFSLLEQKYRLVDISRYLKEKYNTYISDDKILDYFQKIGIPSLKQKLQTDLNQKIDDLNPVWLAYQIKNHVTLQKMADTMKVSTTSITKALRKINLKPLHHGTVWDYTLEPLKKQLHDVPLAKVPEEDYYQMCLGWFAGDGSLNQHARFQISHTLSQFSYLYVKARVLRWQLRAVHMTPPVHLKNDFIGGKEQFGITCTKMDFLLDYTNPDGSKNLEKIFEDLNDLGWACYYMDDGSYLGSDYLEICMGEDQKNNFKNKFRFEELTSLKNLKITGIKPEYILPSLSYKYFRNAEVGEYWKDKFPELFNLDIKTCVDLSLINRYNITLTPGLLKKSQNFYLDTYHCPEFKVSEAYLKKEFYLLSRESMRRLIKNKTDIRDTQIGWGLMKHFCKDVFQTMQLNSKTILDSFNTELKEFFETSLDINHSLLPPFIYDLLLSYNKQLSWLTPGIARVLVEDYCPENGIVYEPFSWTNSVMLGAVTAGRSFSTSIEQDHLLQTSKFFELKDINFVIPDKINLIILTIPGFGLKINGIQITKTWFNRQLQDLKQLAEQKKCVLLVQLPEMELQKETFTDFRNWLKIRQKNTKVARKIYVWDFRNKI
jgi:transposase